jgi:hypothetical protein
MSKMFPDYYIQIENPAFPQVYSRWTTNILSCMLNQAPTLNFIEHIDFWIGEHDHQSIDECLKSDFAKMVKKYRSKRVDHVILAYDSELFPLEDLWMGVRRVIDSKVKFQFTAQVTSAFALTNSINNALLDEQLPGLNLVLMNLVKDNLAV